jgi:uncharacterized protein YegJ (DUF2314 family)
MADHIVLPVPEMLSATYVVPVARDPGEPLDVAKDYVRTRLEEPLRDLVLDFADGPLASVGVLRPSEAPPPPVELLRIFGASEADIRAVTKAKHLVAIRATYQPGWPPAHEWSARAIAAGVASWAGAPIMDSFVPHLVSVDQIERTYPTEEAPLRLASWVLVPQSAGDSGMRMTTKGLGRFGLPELQVENVPPQLAEPMTLAVSGLADALLAWWMEAVGGDERPAFVELTERFEFGVADVASAYGGDPAEDASVQVRFVLDPAQPPGDSFLSLLPPLDYPRSSGEFFAEMCAELFGHDDAKVKGSRDPEAMERAIATARGSLDKIRKRFVRNRLRLNERLLVKFRLEAPDGAEYPWLFVTSWKSADRVHGTSANDAIHDPSVRVGRPLVIATADVVDWAIWVDGDGMIEGGWTNAALED